MNTKITKEDLEKSLQIVMGNSSSLEKGLDAKKEEAAETKEQEASETKTHEKMEKGVEEDEKEKELMKAVEASKAALEEYKKCKMEKGEGTGYPSTQSAKEETMQDDTNAASIGKEGEFMKSEEAGEEKEEEESKEEKQKELVKSIVTEELSKVVELVSNLTNKVETVLATNADLTKSIDDDINKKNDLEKSITGLVERLEKIESTPIPSRTVTSQNYRPHPSLEKSVDSSVQLSKEGDKNKILDLLDKKSGLDTPTPNMHYAQAMQVFESSGHLEKSIVDDLYRTEGIEII
jgi:hypothetical protein